MNLLDELKLVKSGIVKIFSRWHYSLLAITLALIVGIVFFKITSLPGQTFESWRFSITELTFYFVVIYSLLMGAMLSMQLFLWRHIGFHLAKSTSAATTLPGFLSSLLSIACCSPAIAGLATLVGGGVIGFTTTNQTAFALLSLFLMLFSLYFSSRAIASPTCRI